MLLTSALVSRLPVVSSTRWSVPPTARLLTSLPAAMDQVTSVTNVLDDIASAIDLSVYPFMLPVCVLVAFLANSSGIGGAALFGPIFLIVFPALGPQYPLASPAAAVGVAILVESFGFSSGVTGYFRRGLIDFRAAGQWAAVAMPTALLASKYLALPALALKALYSLLMLSLGAYLLREATLSEAAIDAAPLSDALPAGVDGDGEEAGLTTLTERSGKAYTYPTPAIDIPGGLVSAAGGVLCGLLGVGIGEVVLPQLLRRQVPVPVAAATSTLVVALTCAACAGVQISALVDAGGIRAIPWSLVVFMIPGVIVGAQIAARLQGRFSKPQLERAIGSLFGFVGIAFAVLTAKQSGILP